MSKPLSHDLKKVRQIPAGEPFVQLTRELLSSPAWRARSINCMRLIDFLMIEHMNHAGQENGKLMATYDQLVAFGIGRRLVNDSINEAEQLGLILIERGLRRGYSDSYGNTFTLTFVKSTCHNAQGQRYFAMPTNDWKKVDDAEAKRIKQRFTQNRRYTKKERLHTFRQKLETNVTNVNSHGTL